ncbi:MAG: acpP 5 [Planctomycetaceae bacterium]|nr:acpP 5 [Planctomycetaceae bacterium]
MDRSELSRVLRDLYNEDTDSSLDILGDQVNLMTDLGLDSVDMVSLVMQVERHFRIRMSHEELSGIATVGQLLDLISCKLHEEPIALAA